MKRSQRFPVFSLMLAFLFTLSAGLSLVAQQRRAEQQDQSFNSVEEIKSEMSSRTIPTVKFDKTPLEQVIQFFRDQVSFNIIVKDSVDTSKTVSISLNDIPLDRLMKIVLDQKDLTAIFKNGVVQIMSADQVSNLQVRAFDVRDLMLELEDFPGPELKLRNPEDAQGGTEGGGFGGGGSSGGGNEGSFLGGAFEGRSSPSKDPITDTSQFKELVKNNTGGGQWDRGTSLNIKNGIMIVKQSPEVLNEIEYLINRLRQFK